jgi:hypothetical protein
MNHSLSHRPKDRGITMSRRNFGWIFALLSPVAASAQEWTVSATGTIYADSGPNTTLFAPLGTSLIGDTYTETITTDLSQNGSVSCSSLSCAGTFGGSPYGIAAASYTLTMTINGISYTQTETNPVINYGYLIDALSVNDTSTTLQDQVFQQVASSGCTTPGYANCANAYILGFSTSTPFVPNLDFNQSINVSSGLDSGSNSYFSYQPSGAAEPDIALYGSIKQLTVNAVSAPEIDPASAAGAMALLLGSLAVLRGRRRVTW